jgi:hypothetical protein
VAILGLAIAGIKVRGVGIGIAGVLSAGVASAWRVGLGFDARGKIRGEGRRVRRLPAGVGNRGRSRLRRVRTPRNHGREKQRGGQK